MSKLTKRERAAHTLASVEYDWVYTNTRGGRRLHHAASLDDPAAWYDEPSGEAVTTCGLTGEFRVPGVISRIGMPRCAKCCDKLGIARGVGSPVNDAALREWVGARPHVRKVVEAGG